MDKRQIFDNEIINCIQYLTMGSFCNYCDRYKQQYMDMSTSGKMMWLTISPRPAEVCPQDFYELWMAKLLPLRDIARDLIMVVEFSKQLVMHFHIIYEPKDRSKEYRYINGWRSEAQLKLYSGKPQDGLHYLFKDIERSKEYLPGELVVYDRIQLMDTVKSIKKGWRKKQIAKDSDFD